MNSNQLPPACEATVLYKPCATGYVLISAIKVVKGCHNLTFLHIFN